MLPLNVVFIELLGAVEYLCFILCGSSTEMGTAASSITCPERIYRGILLLQSA